MHDAARARAAWIMWFVAWKGGFEHPGKFIARAHTAGHDGGVFLPGALVADTLHELRAMLPKGLTRHERTLAHGPEVAEVWD